ncbi:hypothetical protein ABT215_11275 [Streptomyces sp900105755]|uniref:hypothetical protein n=1 Tax=Streptomyces sp. 900105755 TaxID=3154389 RepID=UPI0033312154
MSVHPVRLLVCDKPLCTTRFIHPSWTTRRLTPPSTLRRAARDQGWRRTPGNQDYCPSHMPWPGFAAWALATPTGGDQ